MGSRLYVTDQISKQRFLVDTGSDLSCFPRRLLHEKRAASDYNLSAANNSTIKTYGFHTLTTNLGLQHTYIWRFIVADVTSPVLGSDFLAYYHLVPDCTAKK